MVVVYQTNQRTFGIGLPTRRAGQYIGDDLTRQQARKLAGIARRHLDSLRRLRTRVERLGFPQDDPLYLYTCRAYDAVHAMHMTAYYASCKSGVGRSEKE